MRQVNLLPEELQKAEKIRFIRNSLVILMSPVIGVLLLFHFFFSVRVGHLRKVAQQPMAFQETQETKKAKDEVDRLEGDVREYGHANKDIIDVFVKHFSSAHLLRVVSQISSDKVWLQGLILDVSQRTCQIDGKSFNTRLVSEFMLELKRLPYFENVELVSMGKTRQLKAREVDFQIICHLK